MVELYNVAGLTDGLNVSGAQTLRYDLDFQDVRNDLVVDDEWTLAWTLEQTVEQTDGTNVTTYPDFTYTLEVEPA